MVDTNGRIVGRNLNPNADVGLDLKAKYPAVAQALKGTAVKDCRSDMNVTWRLPNEELEDIFIKEASKQGMKGLKGHRSVGGIRASIYNAFPLEGVDALASFMEHFRQRNG